ncbi:MAG: NusG domain II-containing protein [Lachnospiraceae bacterium]|nr:NusG domain II-containing protein [Lachnospiraceae bacterium]
MKKADIRLILIVGVICAVLLIGRQIFTEDGATVVVQVDGEVYGTYSLNKNQTVQINDTNVLVIEDGEAYMSEASCPDGLCISQGRISSSGTLIVCLPNRVVVQVIEEDDDGEEDGLDSVAG